MKFIFLFATLSLFAKVHPAKDFKINDKISLKNYANDTVVLEWFNKDCPFVVKHYKSGNMQALKKKYTAKGIKWISILSSAKGKQGFFENDEVANKYIKENKFASTHLVRDINGAIGRAYKAKTTPHMFVIHKGKIVYEGAIDSIASTDMEDVPKAKNYVAMTLDKIIDKKTVAYAKTQAYGCSVKY